jgi:GR25 family glycosyltransferase involved in LPS biosynthesis
MEIDKIFIIHYPPLVDRKKYMDSMISKFNIPYEYICKFTQDSLEIFDSKFIDTSDKNKDKKNSMLIGDKLNSGLTLNNLKACSLEHFMVISDFADSEYQNIIILQDDIIFDDNFPGFDAYVKALPVDYDILYMSNCCGTKLPQQTEGILDRAPQYTSNAGGAYIISKKAAKIISKNALPIYSNWDWELNCIQMQFKMNVYWVKDFLLYDGSEINMYKRAY